MSVNACELPPHNSPARRGGFGKPAPPIALAGLCLAASFLASGVKINAQETVDLRTSPYLPFREPSPAQYNIKFGRLKARLKGNVQSEYNSNINLSDDNARADFSIAPHLAVGFEWLASRDSRMEFNLEFGYRWYLRSEDLSTVSIAPNSRWSHTLVLEEVEITLFDNFGVTVDPVTRGEISGGDSDLLNFRRFHNTAGISAFYQPIRNMTVSGSYSYGIDRSISGEFTTIDRDTHTFGTGTFYKLSPRWTGGVTASYSLTRYIEDFQNDGETYSAGPVISYRPSEFILIQAAAGYTVSQFDDSGTVADRSNAETVTYEFSINHEFNSRMSHSLRLRDRVTAGLGSNFTDLLSAQYGWDAQVNPNYNLNARIAYERINASGRGEKADRYLVSAGTGWQINSKWSAALNYAFALKASDLPDQDYAQHRVTLDLNRQF